MNNIYLSLLVLLLFSCSTPASKKNDRVSERDTTSTENPDLVSETDNDPKSAVLLTVCTQFYKEVCLGEEVTSSPNAIVNESGFYVLDLETHKSALEKTGIFTESFVATQDDVFGDCKRALEHAQITPEEAWEGGIDMNAPPACNFMNYAYYFQAQEYPDTFRLQNTVLNKETAFTEMHFYSGDHSWDHLVYLKIRLRKQSGSWYIHEVEKKQSEE